MSYFGVSNPELDTPLAGMRAARRGRARAQRKRQSHSQMAGRNGGFADPREIMAYHNKGELSDAATIQALSLFGIGGVRAKGMMGGSHRARQQSALMGARHQQASFRSMGSHDGRPDAITVLAYQDRNGGNWSIEINQIGGHVGVGTRCEWRIKSIDSESTMYNVWVKSGAEANYNAAKLTAQAAIEELVEDAPQDFVVDEFGENFQDALGNFWTIRYSTQYTGGVITWVNWTVSSVILNLSYTGQAETKAAARIAALNAVDAWVATEQANNDGGGDATGDDSNGNGSNYSQTFTFNHPGISSSEIGASTWTIVATLTVDGWKFTASSPNWEFPLNSQRTYVSADAARVGAEGMIDASITSAAGNGEDTGGNGGDTGGNGGDTGGNGGDTGETIDLSDYTSAPEIIDGFNMGVIGYRDAHNALVNQFSYSDNDASEALRTESSSNDYISDTDGDTSREEDDILVAQAQQVVPASTGFNMPSTPVLVGGAILVAGVTAVAYTSRRN